MTIAIIGGTGPQGQGLALRFARAGVPVALGSRDAATSAAEIGVANSGVRSWQRAVRAYYRAWQRRGR